MFSVRAGRFDLRPTEHRKHNIALSCFFFFGLKAGDRFDCKQYRILNASYHLKLDIVGSVAASFFIFPRLHVAVLFFSAPRQLSPRAIGNDLLQNYLLFM